MKKSFTQLLIAISLLAVAGRVDAAKFTVTASASPLTAGKTTGGGSFASGSSVTVTAHANPGFAFVDWTVAGEPGVTITSNPYKFSVSSNTSFVANFRDTKPPAVKIISPVKNEVIGSAAFPIQGTASDSVGIETVYYSLNGSAWTIATTTDGFTNWYAWVTLKPDSANTVSAYAVDKSGNKSTNTVNFSCNAAGLAPLSIAGHLAGVTEGTNTQNSFLVSYDSAAIVRVSPNTNDGGEVGTYTYTPTGPDTAELVRHSVFPTPGNGTNELTFSDAYTAAYTDNLGGNGTFNFVLAVDAVPVTLDGGSIVTTSFMNTNYHSTNTFASSTYQSEDSFGTIMSGTYTFTQFTPVAALVVETPTSPTSAVGTTNYIVVWFNEGASPISGYYDYATVSATTTEGPDTGTFVMTPGADSTKFLGPVTLSGLRVVVTPKGQPSFTRTYGNGTFASISLASANEPTDVGINLANTRVTANTGFDHFMALAPAYAVGKDDDLIDITFEPGGAKATFVVNGSTGETGTATISKVAKTAPAAITGHTITLIPTEKGETTAAIRFTNQNFTVTVGKASAGTYTYAPYSPTTALVQANFTSGNGAGNTGYVVLEFVSTAAGTYVSSKPDPSSPGGWKFTPGNFTFTTTK